jgi:hypothetical protein
MNRSFETNILYLSKIFPSDENYELFLKTESSIINSFLVVINKNEAL